MEKHTWLEILSGCDELEQLLRAAVPMADPARVTRVQFLCSKMTGHDGYMTEKASKIASRIPIYCSARRHQKERGGADGVMHDMLYSLLPTIRDVAKQHLTRG